MKKSKSIALFFGSFNPIHVGHQIIANHVAQVDGIDEVWLVVSPQNPHKKKSSLLADNHRLYMANLAVDDNPKLNTSNIEFGLPQPSYTVDTLAYLSEKYPDYSFSLIMGEDNLRSFPKWKNYEVILNNYSIIVYPRVKTIQEDKIEKSELATHENVLFLEDAPILALSASFIRKQIKEKRDVRYLLTEPVFKYCEEMNFYR